MELLEQIIWDSTTKIKSPDHWYGRYKPKLKHASVSTTKFGVNLVIKLSLTPTHLYQSLSPHNVAVSMNGVLLLTFEQLDEINYIIKEAIEWMKSTEENN